MPGIRGGPAETSPRRCYPWSIVHKIGIEDPHLAEHRLVLLDELVMAGALQVLALGFLVGEDDVERDVEILDADRLVDVLGTGADRKVDRPLVLGEVLLA